MLNSLKDKLSKLKKTDNSIVHKLDKMKNIDQHRDFPQYAQDGSTISSNSMLDSSKLEEMQEETVKKIDEILNSKAETINANAESIKTMDNMLSKMDISVSTVKRNLEEYNDRFNKMEETILELLSLYEVVSNTVNPFVGDDENKTANLENFKAIESRLENLEGSFEHLNDNENSIDTSAINDVLQRVRKEFDEKLMDFNEKLIHIMNESTEDEDNGIENSGYENPDHKPVINEIRIPQQPNNSPLLEFINNDSETFIVLINWVEFLMEKVGKNNLMDVLDYYTDIGWISDSVSNKIVAYANGIDYFEEKPTWKLMSQDHTKSLMFIERLRGKRIDVGTLHKIERDVEKVKHHSEPYCNL